MTKFVTAFTVALACVAICAICPDEGVPESCLTDVVSALIELLTALVSLGKSLFAELTTDFALFSTFCRADFSPLVPLEMTLTPLRLSTDFSRPLTDEQYDGLLLPHAASSRTVMHAAAIRPQAPPH